ncbi:MAG TPA: DUF1385 domain-containing protein [Candidatus Avilachnospira avicola]|nr:DUF1385 domain-containing protein [Candidatus Avilachnospira avicola]
MKYSGIGGQAVIEGIMMKNGDRYAVGVRKPDGDIEVKTEEYVSFGKKHAWARLPLIRGVVSFAESMYIGMNTLMYSASFFEDDEDSKPSKFELWLEKRFGDRLDSVIMTFSMVLAFVLAIVIFMWLPLVIAGALRQFVSNDTVMSLIEGVIRVAIFILYIKLVSRTEDIRRTFMYHGAEHKCINCIEHGLPLTVDNVAVSSKQHKRCGTSFIFLVMIISILFFMVIRVDGILLRFLSRILLIPVIAGVSYEVLMAAGKHDNALMNLISKPGLWMQELTTKEPDDSMIEVAIKAVEAVFDWKTYETENFPEGPDSLGRELLKKAEERSLSEAVS